MGSRVRVPATVTALSLALLGCGNSADHAAPDDGTCWTVPADDAVDPDYWFDDSPTVPCSEPHTSETVSVQRLTNPTVADAKEMSDRCTEEVIAYLDISPDHWVHWKVRGFLPSKQEIADGASWVRCDAMFPAWDYGSVRSTTGSAAGVASDPPLDLWTCLDEHPSKPRQPFVPCDQPHLYEQTGTLATLSDLDQYPTQDELEATAQRQCAHGVPEARENVDFTARWDPRSALRDGIRIDGACFMFDEASQPLAPLR
jgi:Septum formation